MRVTLKRADFYARAALKAATEAKYEPTIRLSIHSPAMTAGSSGGTPATNGVAGEFVKGRTKLLNIHDQSLDLIDVTYTVRAQLAVANTTQGISALLTTNVRLGAREARLRALLKAMEGETRAETSAEAVLSRAQALRDKPSDGYGLGRSDHSVEMAAFTEHDVANVRKELKRVVDERAGINDALTAANVSNFITLDETTVATLRKAEILPAE